MIEDPHVKRLQRWTEIRRQHDAIPATDRERLRRELIATNRYGVNGPSIADIVNAHDQEG